MASVTHATYSYRQLRQLYIQNGGSPKYATVMAAIARAESRGRTNARHVNSDGSIDQGLWQINSSNSHLYSGENIYDPNVNAKIAVDLAEHSGNKLKNWTTYKTGAYESFMPKVPPKVKAKLAGFGVFTHDNYAGTDQGVDFRGAGAIPALGSGVVTDVGTSHIIEGGSYPYLIYRLTDGPYKGQFVYIAENFVPSVKQGAKVKAGQSIGRALGTYPYIEVGFNRTSLGWNPSAPLGTDPHAATPAGNTMWEYIQGVAGLKKGGGGGVIGTLEGAGGAVVGGLGTAASAVNPLNLATDAASLFGDATGIHPVAWVKELGMDFAYIASIIGGGFVFLTGFILVAADIGLSSRAGRVAAAVPAGRYIAGAARSKPSRTPKQNKHITPSQRGPQPRTRKVVHVYRDESESERRRRLSGRERSSQNKDDIPF